MIGGSIERDGRTILVSAADIETIFNQSPTGATIKNAQAPAVKREAECS